MPKIEKRKILKTKGRTCKILIVKELRDWPPVPDSATRKKLLGLLKSETYGERSVEVRDGQLRGAQKTPRKVRQGAKVAKIPGWEAILKLSKIAESRFPPYFQHNNCKGEIIRFGEFYISLAMMGLGRN